MDPLSIAAAINLVRELLTAGRDVSNLIGQAIANGQSTIPRAQVDALFEADTVAMRALRETIAAKKTAGGG